MNILKSLVVIIIKTYNVRINHNLKRAFRMNLKKYKNDASGFTIVELLIVIVIIGILAAITIVAYGNISSKAKSASAQTAANSVMRKTSAYVAEPTPTEYPLTFAAMTADSTKSYYISNITNLSGTTEMNAQPASPSVVQFLLCGTANAGVATSYATITKVSGVKIDYWKYDGTPGVQNTSIGTINGTLNSYAISCWPSNA